MAFPTTSVVDNFNRADEGPPPTGWLSNGINSGSSGLSVVSNVGKDTGNGGVWGTTYGPDCEMFLTLSTLMANNTQVRTMICAQQTGSVAVDGYRLTFIRQDANPGFQGQLFRVDDNATTQIGSTLTDSGGALADGAKIGLEMISTNLTMYINRSGTWASTTLTASDATYGTGSIAVWNAAADANMRYDDFGGGTISSGPGPDLGGQPPHTHKNFGPF